MLVCLSKIVPVVCTASKSIKIYQLEELMMLNSATSIREVYFLPSPTIMVLLGATTQTLSSTIWTIHLETVLPIPDHNRYQSIWYRVFFEILQEVFLAVTNVFAKFSSHLQMEG